MKTLEVTSHAGISLKNILFATDFSEASQAALPYAAAIARRYDSQLHVVHVISSAGYIIPSQPGESGHYSTPCTRLRSRMSVNGWRLWRHI